MAKSTAQRRLERILNDEEYGPKLARLRGESERRVLNLIDENKGREARKLILELDEERRTKQRESSLSTLRKKAIERLTDMWRGQKRKSTIITGVDNMTRDELNFALTADYMSLVNRARQPPDRIPKGVPDGVDINVFWYH